MKVEIVGPDINDMFLINNLFTFYRYDLSPSSK